MSIVKQTSAKAPFVAIILIAIPFLIKRQDELARVGIGPAALGTDFLREG